MDNIWWFASRNWIYNKDYKLLPEEKEPNVIALTSPIESWEEYGEEHPDYIVLIITEPILLLMLDEEYNNAVEEKIFSRFTSRNHSVLLDSSVYSGNFNIFKKTYYIRYLYRTLHEAHQRAHYATVKCYEYEHTGTLFFGYYLTHYVKCLAEILKKTNREDIIDLILRSTGNLFTDEEKEAILKRKIIDSQEEDVLDPYAIPDEDESYASTEEQLIEDDSTHDESVYVEKNKRITLEPCWDNIFNYLNRYGQKYLDSQSRKRVASTLGEKTFHALIECLGLMPLDEEIKEYSHRMRQIVSDLRSRSDFNVVPYFSEKDLYSYLEDCIGNGSNIVYNHYVLRSQLLADELDRLLSLFEEFLTVVRGFRVKFEKETSTDGIIYTIRSNSPELTRDNCVDIIKEFTDLVIAVSEGKADIDKLIDEYNLPFDKAESIIRKYSFEYKKLILELKYELQDKTLKLRKNAELECLMRSTMVQDQQMLLEKYRDPSTVLIAETVNIFNSDKQILNMIEGDFHYTSNDEAIISMIQQCVKTNQSQEELISALKTLKDEGIDVRVRKKERSKLVRFLSKVGDMAAGAAFAATADATIPQLIEYLKGLIK